MRRRFLVALAWLGCLLPVTTAAALERDEQRVGAADAALFSALSRADGAAAARLVDERFTWTGSDGRTLTARELRATPPKAGPHVGADLKLRLYGSVAVVTSDLDQVHALRIWVKRGNLWLALAYHEATVTAPPAAGAPVAAAVACENPCRAIPYKPRTARERDALKVWQAIETAVSKGNGAAFAPLVADDFTVVGNYRAQDKPTRIAAINRGPVTPAPLVSASLYDAVDVVVMTAVHQPRTGKPIRMSRVFIKRNGAWLMAISYQTIIENAPPVG
jgi:ketosteroid isomerase-like protein